MHAMAKKGRQYGTEKHEHIAGINSYKRALLFHFLLLFPTSFSLTRACKLESEAGCGEHHMKQPLSCAFGDKRH